MLLYLLKLDKFISPTVKTMLFEYYCFAFLSNNQR